jgi:hypothetical protein
MLGKDASRVLAVSTEARQLERRLARRVGQGVASYVVARLEGRGRWSATHVAQLVALGRREERKRAGQLSAIIGKTRLTG